MANLKSLLRLGIGDGAFAKPPRQRKIAIFGGAIYRRAWALVRVAVTANGGKKKSTTATTVCVKTSIIPLHSCRVTSKKHLARKMAADIFSCSGDAKKVGRHKGGQINGL